MDARIITILISVGILFLSVGASVLKRNTGNEEDVSHELSMLRSVAESLDSNLQHLYSRRRHRHRRPKPRPKPKPKPDNPNPSGGGGFLSGLFGSVVEGATDAAVGEIVHDLLNPDNPDNED